MYKTISEYKDNTWHIYCEDHPLKKLTISCLSNISLSQFWVISEQYPDLVKHLQQPITFMGQFGLNGEVPWPSNTDGALCFIRRLETEECDYFAFNCPNFIEEFKSL